MAEESTHYELDSEQSQRIIEALRRPYEEIVEETAIALWQSETTLNPSYWSDMDRTMKEVYRGSARAALAVIGFFEEKPQNPREG